MLWMHRHMQFTFNFTWKKRFCHDQILQSLQYGGLLYLS